MRFNSAIFDLDGTIMDSAQGIVRSVEYALDKMGVTEYDRQTNLRFIGPPLVDSFMEYYSMSEADALRAVAFTGSVIRSREFTRRECMTVSASFSRD